MNEYYDFPLGSDAREMLQLQTASTRVFTHSFGALVFSLVLKNYT